MPDSVEKAEINTNKFSLLIRWTQLSAPVFQFGCLNTCCEFHSVFSVTSAAVILLWLCVMSAWHLFRTAMTMSIHHSTTQKPLFLRLTEQTILPPPTCQFDGDTEVKYVLTLLLRLWRPRLYNTHGVLVSSLCWHNYQRVAPSLKHAGPWNGPGCLEGDLGSRLTVVFLHSNRVA